jgi:hypothetical protein
MLRDDALSWLRELAALPEADAAAELSARFLGATEAAYRAGAAEMAPAVRDAERDAVVRLLQKHATSVDGLLRGTLIAARRAVEDNTHREAP